MDNSQPITSVCVVADKGRCPVHFQVIENTTDDQDADIWKDGFFKKVTRYICITRQPTEGNLILADFTVMKDNEHIPAGYTCIATTSDSKEPVLKRKFLIAHFVMRGMTQNAVQEIYLTSSKAKTKPDASPRGEINGLALYLKMCLSVAMTQPTPYASQPSSATPHGYANDSTSYRPQGSVVPSPSALPYTFPSRSTLTRQASMVQTNATMERIHSAIEGVPFELLASLQPAEQSQHDSDTLQLPCEQTLQFNYSYDFKMERQVLRKSLTP